MSTNERTPKLRDVLDSYELITPVNDFLWHEPRLEADNWRGLCTSGGILKDEAVLSCEKLI